MPSGEVRRKVNETLLEPITPDNELRGVGRAFGDAAHRARLGEQLRGLRLEKGLRLTDLAALSGLSEAHLSRLEHGERWPSVPALLKLAGIWGVDPSQLLSGPVAPAFMVTHSATAIWRGREESGRGVMHGASARVAYDRAARLALDDGASSSPTGTPEECLAMALAGSYSMSLARLLESAGLEPRAIATYASLQLSVSPTAHSIERIDLTCQVDAPAATLQQMDEIGRLTTRQCVVGRALLSVPISLRIDRTSDVGREDALDCPVGSMPLTRSEEPRL